MASARSFSPPLVAWLVPAAILLVFAAWPALTGSWVLDDLHMLESETSDEPIDVLLAFGRNSVDYLGDGSASDYARGVTYRPLSHATLIAVHGIFGPIAWAHHLVSLGLHMLVCGLLIALARDSRGRVEPVPVALIGLFAFHPVNGEAWLWINGRSDVLAGVFVVAIALAMRRNSPGDSPFGALRWAGVSLLVLAAALSKEPAGIAACGVVVACSTRALRGAPSAGHAGRVLFAMAAVCLAAGLATIGLKALTIPAGIEPVAATSIDVWALLRHTPLAAAVGAESVLVPIARPMRLIDWEMLLGWTPARLASLVGAFVFAVLVVRRRGIGAAVLWVTALVTFLIPVLMLLDRQWVGLDRYLYLPNLLVLIAILDVRPGARDDAEPERSALRPAVSRAPGAMVAAALVAVLGVLVLRSQAAVYASNDAFVEARVRLQPESPHSWHRAAAWLIADNRPAAARALLEMFDPEMENVWVVSHEIAGDLLRVGLAERAAEVVEVAWRQRPSDALVALDHALLLAARGEVEQSVDLLGAIELGGPRCAAAREAVQAAAAREMRPPLRAALDALAARATCAD